MGRKKRRWGRIVLAGLVVAAGAGAFVVWQDRQPSEAAADLEAFDAIDLGAFQGEVVAVGSTRSGLLPAVVRRGPGESRLLLINVLAATVIDAGKVPFAGELPDVFPTASDGFVTMVAPICEGGVIEADAGTECEQEVSRSLLAYDLASKQWRVLGLGRSSAGMPELVDTDGPVAVLRAPGVDGAPDRWAKVALDRALVLGAYATEAPAVRPNAMVERLGHMEGNGWQTQISEEGGALTSTWTGTTGGKPDTVVIDLPPERTIRGAGNCIAILTRDGDRLEHLHALCAD